MFRTKSYFSAPMIAAAAVAIVGSMLCARSQAQVIFRPVGGVRIDAAGVVSNPEVGDLKELQVAWQKGLAEVPADMNAWTDLRFVSLRQLEAEIATARAAGRPL